MLPHSSRVGIHDLQHIGTSFLGLTRAVQILDNDVIAAGNTRSRLFYVRRVELVKPV